MRPMTRWGLGLLFLLAISAWVSWQPSDRARSVMDAVAAPAGAEERPVLYYQDPDGKPYYSLDPKKDEGGRDYLPVYDDAVGIAAASAAAAPPKLAAQGERKILY